MICNIPVPVFPKHILQHLFVSIFNSANRLFRFCKAEFFCFKPFRVIDVLPLQDNRQSLVVLALNCVIVPLLSYSNVNPATVFPPLN